MKQKGMIKEKIIPKLQRGDKEATIIVACPNVKKDVSVKCSESLLSDLNEYDNVEVIVRKTSASN